MSGHQHVLANQIMGKPDLESCSIDEIRDLAERYPFFTPASFLLLEKLKSQGSPEYGVLKQKALLQFYHPLALEMLLNGEQFVVKLAPAPVHVEEDEHQPEILPEPEAALEELPETEVSAETEVVSEPDAGSESDVLSGADVAEESEPQMELPKINLPSLDAPPDESTGLSFEPYHTVDYFASQGIKLSQEMPETDKFGKQLKSFTAWLKTMKKIPASAIAQQVDAGSEAKVENMAADSIHNAEVLTESMAEVWVKQGNHRKARDVYEKLSLQNPHKKEYFAAKIELLKP